MSPVVILLDVIGIAMLATNGRYKSIFSCIEIIKQNMMNADTCRRTTIYVHNLLTIAKPDKRAEVRLVAFSLARLR